MTAGQRPFPLIYAAILVAEIAVGVTVVGMFGRHPPYTYELGWAGCASFVAMQVYSVRRRVGWLRRVGSLDGWLDVHVFLGFQGLVFVAYHCVGISPEINLATTNAGVVVTLVLTGILGRYLFQYIPQARTHVMWSLLHRPLAFLLLSLTTLHVLAHFAYRV